MSYFKGGNIIKRLNATVSSGSMLTLTVTSAQFQLITGTSAQSVTLPDATTCPNGLGITVINQSTMNVSVYNSSATLIATLNPQQSAEYVVSNNSITTGFTSNQGATGNTTVPPQVISGSNIDWSTSDMFTQILGANTTFTFSNQAPGKDIIVRLTNTVSNYTVTWPVSVKWIGGTPPVMSTGATTDVYTFIYDGSNTYGAALQGY